MAKTSESRSRQKPKKQKAEKKLISVKLRPFTLKRLREFGLNGEFGSKHNDNADVLVNRVIDLQDTHVAAQQIKVLLNQIRLYEAVIDKDRLQGKAGKKFKLR